MLMVYGFCILLKIVQLISPEDRRLMVHAAFIEVMFACKDHEGYVASVWPH